MAAIIIRSKQFRGSTDEGAGGNSLFNASVAVGATSNKAWLIPDSDDLLSTADNQDLSPNVTAPPQMNYLQLDFDLFGGIEDGWWGPVDSYYPYGELRS